MKQKHELKILDQYFEAVNDGIKNFEIRNNNDRGFQKGDLVLLREVNDYNNYTGREKRVEITYVTNYQQQPGYVVFGFADY